MQNRFKINLTSELLEMQNPRNIIKDANKKRRD
jgi:hypothetical protein